MSEISVDMENIYTEGTPMAYTLYRLLLKSNPSLEYIDGKLYVLPKCNTFHDTAKNKLLRQIDRFLYAEGSKCEVFTECHIHHDSINKSIKQKSVRPDVFVACDFVDQKNDYKGTPILIIEILSEYNSDHDLITKKKAYKDMGVFEYIILDSRTFYYSDAKIYQYTLNSKYEDIFDKSNTILHLNSINFDLDLSIIYEV